jgi:hypothetical protein
MAIDPHKIQELVSLIRKDYPNWNSFSDPAFVKEEIVYKQDAVKKGKKLLGEEDFSQLIIEQNYDEINKRLYAIGQSTNLLYLSVPLKGDLNILHQLEAHKSTFYKAVFDLIYGPEQTHERLDRFLDYVDKRDLPHKWTFPTYFLFIFHPDKEIFIKPSIVKWLIKFASFESEIDFSSHPSGKTYNAIRLLHFKIKEDLKDYNPKDMIDIQSFIWTCAYAYKKQAMGTVDMPPVGHNLIDRIQSILERKGQVILYGPPGTGKTYWAEKASCAIAARTNFYKDYDGLSEEKKTQIQNYDGNSGLVRICCFHPAYGYEDFIEGYRPEQNNGKLNYLLKDGIFKKLCIDAHRSPQNKFYLIIDEINRGDIPRIFGELMTILEKDKRGKAIVLPLSEEHFSVPENVYLIGTMNTADRSIALLDTALRRRFGFIELMPDGSVFSDATVKGLYIGQWLDALNQRICRYVGKDARNLQIGHSYFLDENGSAIKDFSKFASVLRQDIVPLLEEYCYEDYQTLEKILGTGLFDAESHEINKELFRDSNHIALFAALNTILIESQNDGG